MPPGEQQARAARHCGLDHHGPAAAADVDIIALLTAETPQRDRVAALRMADEHGGLDVVDQLLSAATPVDGVDADGSTALHEAAYSGRAGGLHA